MGAADLDSAVRRLYALPLDQFLTTRKELVAEARAAKDRELAVEVGALRKPSTAAYLVNQLVRLDPAPLAELVALGGRLREAQSRMDGEALRSLGRERTGAVRALVRRVGDLAPQVGVSMSEAVGRELHETFTAASTTEAAAEAVTSGRLLRALSYVGFGDVDVSEAVAALSASRTEPSTRSAPQQRERTGLRDGERDDEAMEGAVEAGHPADPLAAERQAAEALVAERRAALAQVTADQRALEDEVNDLEDRLEEARARLVELLTARGRAARAFRDAESALADLK